MFLEWQSELFQKGISLFVRLGCGNESDFHSVNARVLVHVDFREDNLLFQTESVVSAAVELLRNTVEVADTRKSYTETAIEALLHHGCTKTNLHTDRLTFTEMEVGDILSRSGENCFLSYDC